MPAKGVSFRPSVIIPDDYAELLNSLPTGAEAGFVVIDLERGTTIADHNAERFLLPASTVKLATALVALDVLGPDHRYRTELRTNGTVDAGLLRGDLILRGGGDPLLDIADLITLAKSLKNRGVREITGRFLIDDTLLPRFTEIASSQPLEASYNPSIGALSLAFNRVHLSWENKDEPVVATVPVLDEAWFEHAARDTLPPSGIQLKQSEQGRILWQLADRGSRRSKRSLPVKDPGLHAGRVFADMAAMHGIDLPSPVRAALPSEYRVIAVHESRPLRDLVRDMLRYSNNLMAELIGLSVARQTTPELESLEASADILVGHLERLLPKVDWSKTVLDNHSGLNSQARLTPAQLTAILRLGWEKDSLVDLLPISGWSGTLARRFTGQDEALRIWAKTGSINYADTLAGFLLSPSHGPAVFAIMIADFDARAAYDTLPRRTRVSEMGAARWHQDVRAIVDQIVESWLLPAASEPADQEPGQA